MPDTTLNDIPFCECPHCNAKFRLDDYYNLENVPSIECPKCENKIYIIEVETKIVAKFSTEKPD